VKEIWDNNHDLIAAHPDEVGADVAGIVAFGKGAEADGVRAGLARWRESFGRIFDRVQLLALPTMPIFAPRIDAVRPDSVLPLAIEMTKHATLFNAAGTPCTAQPVPAAGSRLPASLQLVGPLKSEALLLATARVVESAV
jgi:Asp-tRNA(Asn)/Glu-tRNA(Gln) amidotransferase A subunit family amidase